MTKTLDGDQTINIDGVSFQFIDLGRAHTDTNFAIRLPDLGILFAADTVAVKALLPTGGVGLYYPDYLAALDKLESLEFDTFVSSHFAWGNKQDFVDAAELQRNAYKWVREAIELTEDAEGGVAVFQDKERMKQAFGHFSAKMKPLYGDWHASDAQLFSTFTGALVAIHVGA